MIQPKSAFRPDPTRSILVQGIIDLQMVRDLTPTILRLLSENRKPITIYIDSNGGSVDAVISLLQLVKSRGQDYEKPCNLVTVVTRRAASAAADLLSAGDYALAYPDATVLYHGGRVPEDKPITAERSSFLAQMLRMSNESSAMDLAREIEFRFLFRFITSRSQFAKLRQDKGDPDLSDLECFLAVISEDLSDSAKDVLKQARHRYKRYETLVNTVVKKTKNLPKILLPLEVEAAQIQAIVEFEVSTNKQNADFQFRLGGLQRLTDDYLLFQEYQRISRSARFKWWCSQYGSLLVAAEELKVIKEIPDEKERAQKLTERVSPILQPVWSFFFALCHTLQQGENDWLTASDCYWMGLIDEVIGAEELSPLRLVYETVDEPEAQAANQGGEKAEAAAGAKA